MATAARPAASWHPQPQQNQDQLFPEVEEFLLMFYGYGWFTLLFVDLSEHVASHV